MDSRYVRYCIRAHLDICNMVLSKPESWQLRECFSPPATLETQSSQRENMISFLLRGQKRNDLQRDSYAHKNMLFNKMTVPGSVCWYLFSFVLQVPRFSAGSKENKSKNRLCVLRASAVKIVFSKTISGLPFKPFF